MDKRLNPSDDRAQAFTLEGLVSAIIVLTAVLFALQAAVITPTTGGAVDRAAMGQEEQEIRDVLIVAGEKGNLSDLVRYWDPESGEWANKSDDAPQSAYNSSQFAELSDFGGMLDEHVVNESGKSYNVDFIAHDLNPAEEGDDPTTESIVRMGGGASDSVVSESYTVLVHEDQKLTKKTENGFENRVVNEGEKSKVEVRNDDYPFSPGDESNYVLVKVRVTVW